jgi:gluconate 2-dehydrogenase gamma chain
MQSRRDWILGSLGTIAWQEIAAAQQHAHESVKAGGSAHLEMLDAETGAEIAALASQIIPSEDGPGATDAGVIYFIDRALATFDADKRDDYRTGMAAVQEKRKSLFPNSTSIASLPAAKQVELMRAIEPLPFFELLRVHTLLGFLGDPTYGGNRGKVGWKHIGFEDSMAFQPPFGYYDGEALKGAKK